MAGSSPALIIFIICVGCSCLFALIAAILFFTNTACDWFDGASWAGISCEAAASPQSPQSPAAATRSTVRSLGELLQGPSLEIGDTNPIPLNNQPSIPSTVEYTVSFDLYYDSAGTTWRELLAPMSPSGQNRRPLFSLSGTDPNNEGANKFIVVHSAGAAGSTISGEGLSTSQLYPPKVWYNIVFTVDTNTIKLYINGVYNTFYTYTSPLSWSGLPWFWRPTNNGIPATNKSIKVANAYFWSSILSESQISLLKVNPASSPTTSTYMPEPYSMTNNTKEF